MSGSAFPSSSIRLADLGWDDAPVSTSWPPTSGGDEQWRSSARRQLRAPQRWFDVLVWPMVDTVIWGSIGLFVNQQGGAGRAGVPYMLSGILLMHVMYQANVSMSCGFLDETWSRNLVVPAAAVVLWRTLRLFRARGYLTRYS